MKLEARIAEVERRLEIRMRVFGCWAGPLKETLPANREIFAKTVAALNHDFAIPDSVEFSLIVEFRDDDTRIRIAGPGSLALRSIPDMVGRFEISIRTRIRHPNHSLAASRGNHRSSKMKTFTIDLTDDQAKALAGMCSEHEENLTSRRAPPRGMSMSDVFAQIEVCKIVKRHLGAETVESAPNSAADPLPARHA